MKSPKDLLLKDNERLNKFLQITGDPNFEELLHIAYAEYCFNLPKGENVSKDWDANCRRAGAFDFMWMVTSITSPVKENKRVDNSALKYE